MKKTPEVLAAVFSLFLISLASSLASSTAATSLITGTCKQTPDVNLCVSTLTADPRGPKAGDVRTLALLMIDAVKSRATTTYDRVKRLLKTAPPELEGPLKNCASYYDTIVTQEIPEAEEAVSKGAPKYGEDGMNGSANEARLCEDEFRGKKVKSPLTGENNLVRGLAAVGASIIRQLE